MNKNAVIIIIVLVIASVFFYLGSRSSTTGNVINDGSDKIVNSEPKEDQLIQESNVISEVDYQVEVEDKITGNSLEDAEVKRKNVKRIPK